MTKQNIERRGDNQTLRDIIPEPKGMKLWASYWESPEALCAHVETLNNGAQNWNDRAWTAGESFTGSASMAEAIRLCRAGWPAGAARVAALRDKINAANPIGPRVIKWDVAGAVASVPRALAGNPLNMRRIDSAKLRRRPVLTLLSDMSANGGVEANAITNRAAVVAAIVDAIEAKGFSCHVVTFEYSTRDKLGQIVAATVKESDAAADIGRLAFGLGHCSMFRRLSWAAFTCDRFTAPLGQGLGAQTELNIPECNARGAYVIRTAGVNERAFATEEQAATAGLAWLISELQKQNCPAFPVDDRAAA